MSFFPTLGIIRYIILSGKDLLLVSCCARTDIPTQVVDEFKYINRVFNFLKSIFIYSMKSTDIKTKLDKLNKEITNYWHIIRTENIIDNGMKRHYDMKALLNVIQTNATERIQLKMDQLCINLGFKKRSDFPSESIYPIIFELSEKNEQYVQLGLIKTIDPNIKMKKGKKKMSINEELTRDYISKLMNNLSLEINGLRKKLSDFNEKAELDTSTAFTYLTA